MEAAMVLCAAIAVASAAPIVPPRVRATAAVALIGLGGLLVVAPPSVAEPLPPIVRLADEAGVAEPIDAHAGAATIHVVVRGESLWRIAAAAIEERTGDRPSSGTVATFWPEIYERNRPIIGDDPNVILPGQHLEIPSR
jgi:nucleoid-associated protein YgaU